MADRVAESLGDRGHDAEAVDVDDFPADLDLDAYDAVVVGASIHGGKHQTGVRTFVETHLDALSERPAAFFQVCLSAAGDDAERTAEAAGYVDGFLDETGWEPERVATFAGALRYSEYGFLKRAVLKRIVREFTGDTDTSRDYEYTDWDAVSAFAADVAALVASGVTADPVAPGPQRGTEGESG